MVTVFVSKEWRCNSIDVKATILQGKANVFVNPPPPHTHTNIQEDNMECKLKTYVYGLNDNLIHGTSEFVMSWFNSEPDLRYTIQNYFTGNNNNDLHGLLVKHVDICWGRPTLFEKEALWSLRKAFEIDIGSCSSFKYLGLFLQQKGDLLLKPK